MRAAAERSHTVGMRAMAMGLMFLVGCAGEFGGDATPDVAAPSECMFYPEAGEYITPCTNAAGQWIEHDGMRCVLGHNRNDTLGLDGGPSCTVTYSNVVNYAVSSCGDC